MHLYCVQGKERGQRFALQINQEKIIGRDPGSDGIQFLDIMASRQHIKICAHLDCITVTDLGSANGTRVNGQALHGSIDAYPGDIVTMGNTSLVIEDPLHSTSAADEVERISRHHRTSQRLKSQMPTQLLNTADDDSEALFPAANLNILTGLLSSLPLAVIIFNEDNKILVANNAMKNLCNIEISAGQTVHSFFEQLQKRLQNPSLLQTLLLSSQDDAIALATDDHQRLFAWSSMSTKLRAIYLLPESSLGKT